MPILARCLLPSPCHARLGLLCLSADNLSRRQDSRDVAARALAPSVEALDAPLGAADLSTTLGPATERIGAYSGGTCTRRSGAASLDAPWKDSSVAGRAADPFAALTRRASRDTIREALRRLERGLASLG